MRRAQRLAELPQATTQRYRTWVTATVQATVGEMVVTVQGERMHNKGAVIRFPRWPAAVVSNLSPGSRPCRTQQRIPDTPWIQRPQSRPDCRRLLTPT